MPYVRRPLLFSIYVEVMMIEAFGDSENLDEEDIAIEDFEDGIVVGGKIVRDVRFADDQGMVSSTERGLRNLMNKLNDTEKKFNMKINVQKTTANFEVNGVHASRYQFPIQNDCSQDSVPDVVTHHFVHRSEHVRTRSDIRCDKQGSFLGFVGHFFL